jgi:hypothetical protein
MSRVGFEPTTPVFEQAKTVDTLDRAALMMPAVLELLIFVFSPDDYEFKIIQLNYLSLMNTPSFWKLQNMKWNISQVVNA